MFAPARNRTSASVLQIDNSLGHSTPYIFLINSSLFISFYYFELNIFKRKSKFSINIFFIDSEMFISLLLLISILPYSNAIRFYLPPNGRKCLKEEIHKNVVVTGEYEFSEGVGYQSSVHVCSQFVFFLQIL